MAIIGNFPARSLIRKWLKAGVMKGLDFTLTPSGTPQGGIISPLLANIALHGMEQALGIERKVVSNGYPSNYGPVKVIRYADDFVVLANSKARAEWAQSVLTEWLQPRGLQMSQAKTTIVSIDDGFDFLGFNIRRVPNVRRKSGRSIYVTPSKKAVKRLKDKIRKIITHGRSTHKILQELNPLIYGWGLYYRSAVSQKVFDHIDNFIWNRAWRTSLRSHQRKGKNWVRRKYFTTSRKNRWVYYDQKSGKQVQLLTRIPIRRYVKVRGTASPDDPNLEIYWEKRIAKKSRFIGLKDKVWRKQKGVCSHCERWLDGDEEIHLHHVNRNRDDNRLSNLQLLHRTCHYQLHNQKHNSYASS